MGRVWTLSVGKGLFEASAVAGWWAMYPTCRCGFSCAAGHNAIRAAQVPISSHSKCTAQLGSPDPADPALCISSCLPFRKRTVRAFGIVGPEAELASSLVRDRPGARRQMAERVLNSVAWSGKRLGLTQRDVSGFFENLEGLSRLPHFAHAAAHAYDAVGNIRKSRGRCGDNP